MLQFLENGRITQKVFVLRMSDLLKVPFLYYVIKSKSKLVDFHVILSCSLSNHLQEVVPFFLPTLLEKYLYRRLAFSDVP